eukprot:jgi/Astpho2/9095/Aster-02749
MDSASLERVRILSGHLLLEWAPTEAGIAPQDCAATHAPLFARCATQTAYARPATLPSSQVSTPKVHHMRERQARARRGAVLFTPTAPGTYTQHEAASSGGPAFGRPASKSAVSARLSRDFQLFPLADTGSAAQARPQRQLFPLLQSQGCVPQVEVVEQQDAYSLLVALPGVESRALRVEVKDARLIVRGSRPVRPEAGSKLRTDLSWGPFEAVFEIPPRADSRRVTASYKHGLLKVLISKI